MADLRRCIGSARFGIEPHEAPVEDFPKQPSQKDGIGPDVEDALEPIHRRARPRRQGPQGGRHREGARTGLDGS